MNSSINIVKDANIQNNNSSQQSRQEIFTCGFSVDENCFDRIRSSPSVISNSEPPSYFEALSIATNAVILNTERTSTIFQTQLNNNNDTHKPTILTKELSYSSETKHSSNQPPIPTIFYNNPSCPHYQRHHVFRNQNILEHSNQFDFASSLRVNSSSSNMQKPSDTYLVWSIFTTIYCVFVGIFALILSIRVYHFNKQGDYDKAHSRSKIARNLNIVGLFFGVVYLAIGVITCLIPRT